MHVEKFSGGVCVVLDCSGEQCLAAPTLVTSYLTILWFD